MRQSQSNSRIPANWPAFVFIPHSHSVGVITPAKLINAVNERLADGNRYAIEDLKEGIGSSLGSGRQTWECRAPVCIKFKLLRKSQFHFRSSTDWQFTFVFIQHANSISPKIVFNFHEKIQVDDGGSVDTNKIVRREVGLQLV